MSHHGERPRACVLGADIGGSTTRVAVADLDGTVLARAQGGPGNPNVVGLRASAATVASVLAEALASVERADPLAVVLGLAGATRLRDQPEAAAWTEQVLPGVGVRLVSDFAVAFSSGTDAPRGVAAITGTGAGAMRIDGGTDGPRRDAWGWLLGDQGSGFWIGREAVRTTLRQVETGRTSALGTAVRHEFGIPPGHADPVTALLQGAYQGPPRRLADLAPLVSAHQDDPAAVDILARAADAVSHRILELTVDEPDLPIVLAGSVSTGNGPLAGPIRDRLTARGHGLLHEAGDGLIGALWLALTRHCAGSEPPPRWAHLVGSLGSQRS